MVAPHLIGHDRRVVFSRVGKVDHPHPSIFTTSGLLLVAAPAISAPGSAALAPEQPVAAAYTAFPVDVSSSSSALEATLQVTMNMTMAAP